VFGDSGRVRQVLANYLNNAVKFTRQGEIAVKVSVRPLDDRHRHEFHFAVRDTGIGIAADKVAQLFQSFSQVDSSSTRNYGGTGLGLAICKRLCEMMGGRVWVHSEPGRGSTFHFTIVCEVAEMAARPTLHPSLRDRCLLVVDDNASTRRALCAAATRAGMQVRETASAREAMAWLKDGQRFDVVAIDYVMPEMDGVTLAKLIRSELGPSAPPMIMLSAASTVQLARTEFAALLPKPVKLSVVHDVFACVLGDAKAASSRAAPLVAKAAANAEALRVLVVEDNPINQKVALRMLESLGYRADIAGDGAQAIAALEKRRYDVVFMDMQMPVMDGLEATRAICRRWPEDRPKIIAMTANALLGDRERCIEAGMDDYLAKPIERARLTEILGAIVEVRSPHSVRAMELF